MKVWRLCLLLLLTVLVPIRGAWALVACEQAKPHEVTVSASLTAPAPTGSPCHGMDVDAGNSTPDDNAGHDDALCGVCATGCHASVFFLPDPALSVSTLAEHPPAEATWVAWPNVDLPGLKRPPRTI